jgi:hypothetical protein
MEGTRLGVNETLSLLKQNFLQHQLQKQGKKELRKKGLVTGKTITWGEK